MPLHAFSISFEIASGMNLLTRPLRSDLDASAKYREGERAVAGGDVSFCENEPPLYA